MSRLHSLLIALLMAVMAAPASATPLNAAEKTFLDDLYTGTNGPGWTNNTNWTVGDPCSNNWYGITCDATGDHVTGIYLMNNNLTGPLPASLNQLTALQQFYAYQNHLSGSIPSLTGLIALQGFSVQNNQLTGTIPSLVGLTALRQFDVVYNQLTGSIPSLTGLTALQAFYATKNQLTGSIPSLTGLNALHTFVVAFNQLTGSIPSLAGLSALVDFAVDDNQLTGPIPSLTGLTALQNFAANNNLLTGIIPSLAGLNALQGFAVQNNQLTGSIPSLAGLSLLTFFNVVNNHLIGPVPDLAGLNVLAQFYVSFNQLTGTPPAAPTSLAGAGLCPNFLHTPSPTDAAWDAAVGGTWSFDCTPGYLVSTAASAGGNIDPARAVQTGLSTTITVTPDATHTIDSVTGCGGTLAGNTYTTGAITADCTVTASFRSTATPTAVPTLGEWGLMALGLLAAGLGARRLRQRD